MNMEGSSVTRDVFEKNLAAKVNSRAFNEDLRPLLAPGIHYDAKRAATVVADKLLSLL